MRCRFLLSLDCFADFDCWTFCFHSVLSLCIRFLLARSKCRLFREWKVILFQFDFMRIELTKHRSPSDRGLSYCQCTFILRTSWSRVAWFFLEWHLFRLVRCMYNLLPTSSLCSFRDNILRCFRKVCSFKRSSFFIGWVLQIILRFRMSPSRGGRSMLTLTPDSLICYLLQRTRSVTIYRVDTSIQH